MATPSYIAFGDGLVYAKSTGVLTTWAGTPTPTAPVAAYITRAGNVVTVRFDKEVARVDTGLAWSNGFTIQLDAVTTPAAVVRKVTGGIEFEYEALTAASVTVAYAGTNLIDAFSGTVIVATFTAVTAVTAASVGRSMLVYTPLLLDADTATNEFGLVMAADMASIARSLGPITVDATSVFGPRSSLLLTVTSSAQLVRNGSIFSITLSGGTVAERANIGKAWLEEAAARVACALDELCVQYAAISNPTVTTFAKV